MCLMKPSFRPISCLVVEPGTTPDNGEEIPPAADSPVLLPPAMGPPGPFLPTTEKKGSTVCMVLG